MININRKSVTTIDVARHAGVSQATVSLVLSGARDSLTPKTVERVLEAAEALGYTYRPRARRLESPRGQRIVAIMASSLPNPYYSELITSIEQAAEEANLLPLVCDTYRSPALEEKYLCVAASLKVVGMIFTYMPVGLEAVLRASQDMPVVVVGDKAGSVPLDAVEFDSFTAGQLVAEHLIELGHTHMAFLSTPMNTGNLARVRRLEGFRHALRAHGLEANLAVRLSDGEASYKDLGQGGERHIGYEQTLDILKRHPDVTALVGVNDMLAYGILDALRAHGHAIPRSHSVCGFDNIRLSSLRGIDLTTVDYFSEAKGRDALEILLRKRSKDALRDSPSVLFKMEYAPKLVVRGTSAPCRRP